MCKRTEVCICLPSMCKHVYACTHMYTWRHIDTCKDKCTQTIGICKSFCSHALCRVTLCVCVSLSACLLADAVGILFVRSCITMHKHEQLWYVYTCRCACVLQVVVPNLFRGQQSRKNLRTYEPKSKPHRNSEAFSKGGREREGLLGDACPAACEERQLGRVGFNRNPKT